jgi:RNA polymerase sigma factor (sigma-70 family)
MNALVINMTGEQDRQISDAVEKEGFRLRNFIRRRVDDPSDVEDILQDVFFEFVEAYRLMKPIEQAGAWLFRVARNRIIDRFRKKKPTAFGDLEPSPDEPESSSFEDLLPSPDAGPEAVYIRGILLDEIEAALDELPPDQRQIFIANEIEGRSFKELSSKTGESINTLLSRKRYAVLHLRRKLQAVYEEFLK